MQETIKDAAARGEEPPPETSQAEVLPLAPIARGQGDVKTEGQLFYEQVQGRDGYAERTFAHRRWHSCFVVGRATHWARPLGRSPLDEVLRLVPRYQMAVAMTGLKPGDGAEAFDALDPSKRQMFVQVMSWGELIDTCALVWWCSIRGFYPKMTLDDILMDIDLGNITDIQSMVLDLFAVVSPQIGDLYQTDKVSENGQEEKKSP